MSSGVADNPEPVTSAVMQKVMANAAVVANMRRQFVVSRDYDIPFIAGYSKDGRTLYIDKDMPKAFMYRGRTINSDRFLLLHEQVEKALIDAILAGDDDSRAIMVLLKMTGPDDDIYYHTHGVATAVEEATFAMVYGSSLLGAYNAFMDQHIKEMLDQTIKRVPEDLDLTPYTSSEDPEDRELLQYMKRRMLD